MKVEDLKMPNIHIRRGMTNGKVVEIIDYDEYVNNQELYVERNDIGITVKPAIYGNQEMVLPLRNNYNGNPITPGVYNAGAIDFYVYPDKDKVQNYIPDKIIDFDNRMDVKEMIESGESALKLDEAFITTPDNITKLNILPEDEPEMIALKCALNEKNMDIDKYANRFGANFPNDKRQLKGNSVTLNIIKRFCNNMDMEAVLTIRNKHDNVPNPMRHEVSIALTGLYTGDEDE